MSENPIITAKVLLNGVVFLSVGFVGWLANDHFVTKEKNAEDLSKIGIILERVTNKLDYTYDTTKSNRARIQEVYDGTNKRFDKISDEIRRVEMKAITDKK